MICYYYTILRSLRCYLLLLIVAYRVYGGYVFGCVVGVGVSVLRVLPYYLLSTDALKATFNGRPFRFACLSTNEQPEYRFGSTSTYLNSLRERLPNRRGGWRGHPPPPPDHTYQYFYYLCHLVCSRVACGYNYYRSSLAIIIIISTDSLYHHGKQQYPANKGVVERCIHIYIYKVIQRIVNASSESRP